MLLELKNPPREFAAGGRGNRTVRDCGTIQLEPDEMVTFVTPDGRQWDITRTAYGQYVSQSLNCRLPQQGYKVALTRNRLGRLYIQAVERDKIDLFRERVIEDGHTLLEWLDERA